MEIITAYFACRLRDTRILQELPNMYPKGILLGKRVLGVNSQKEVVVWPRLCNTCKML